MSKKKKKDANALATNRKARRNFEIIDTIEAGIELRGCEVKAIRENRVSIEEAFAQFHKQQVFLHQLHVEPYSHGSAFTPAPDRLKRLLLHKAEIIRLMGQVAQQGLALIPLKLYTKDRLIKVELGLGKGKNVLDKRETIKRRMSDRETARALKNARAR